MTMWRFAGFLILIGSAGSAVAQNVARDQLRFRAEQRECQERFRITLEAPRNGCSGACREVVEMTRDRCLARAQERYDKALRHALRPYNR